MPEIEYYDFISSKIEGLKEVYPSLRSKSDDYIFTILSIKSNFYKNPSLQFDERNFNCIVDGACDGGVDAMLTDPNSEASDFVLVQSKHWTTISFEDVKNAIIKMAQFYKNMKEGHYERISNLVQRRFLNLDAEVGDESKVCFVLYTSAKKGGIQTRRVERAFRDIFPDTDKYIMKLYYANDIYEEIRESESRRATVETGRITIDRRDNYLSYGENAVYVNASAFSIRELYGQHSLTLLAKNLRFHVPGREIDKGINETIANNPKSFWYKNNGLTIICEDFEIDGIYAKLKNFSVVNGGQTTYMLHKNNNVEAIRNIFIPCKIIKSVGNNEDEKNKFTLEIAQAANSQKAIKKIDLKSNAPEQIRFYQTMRDIGIYYQTKRGEPLPSNYREQYKNTDLAESGKLCLSAIYQLPATSRNKPSSLYLPEYYDLIFHSDDQRQVAKLISEFLYIDYYFRNRFLDKFDSEFSNNPNASDLLSFAHNARTACLSFVSLASRIHYGNFSSESLTTLFRDNNISDTSSSGVNYPNFRNIENFNFVFPPSVFSDKDKYDEFLYKLFVCFIKCGRQVYSINHRTDASLSATNFLKKDSNYYAILKDSWETLSEQINSIFNQIDEWNNSHQN